MVGEVTDAGREPQAHDVVGTEEQVGESGGVSALPRYFGFRRGLSVLTSVTDHYATFGTKVIPTRVREGLFALDEIFALRDRDSELRIAEHTDLPTLVDSLVANRVNVELIVAHWDDLLRLGASIHRGPGRPLAPRDQFVQVGPGTE